MDANVEEKLVGRITHYFSRLSVGAIELTDGELKVGDTIHISGRNTDFAQRVGSMQIEHQNIHQAEKGKLIGVKVKDRVREHDQVFRVQDCLLEVKNEWQKPI
jgi:putative protease